MASSVITTSSSETCIELKSRCNVDATLVNKLKIAIEKSRVENASLKKSLALERSGARAMKAQFDANIRNLKIESKMKMDVLEKQIRNSTLYRQKNNKTSEAIADVKKLTAEVQYLKSTKRNLQEKLKMAVEAEAARAAELNAAATKHASDLAAAEKCGTHHTNKLLEEIRSKDRLICQLRKAEKREPIFNDTSEMLKKMETGPAEKYRKPNLNQKKDKNDREDLKTDIQHRKETYRDPPLKEVPVSKLSLNPEPTQPLVDMRNTAECVQCGAARRECARLTSALRDARDQIELMEFRLLELEEPHADKSTRDNLTDSDSGCVSPGSRIKDSASPELKRMDSGYKSPHSPASPCSNRRFAAQEDFKDFAKAQALAELFDRDSDAGDSLKSNPAKEHLETMILNAGSVEDRNCLEQVLMMLYNQTLGSYSSEDEFYQIIKTNTLCDSKPLKADSSVLLKTHKAIATVSPYQQHAVLDSGHNFSCEEKKPLSILQESGIFEDTEIDSKSTQTDVNETFDGTSELNTEIQRLNSIRKKLEKQGVPNKNLHIKDEVDGLECRCVKLGKKHKQYYERRLTFLEGKVSIYEAATDIRETKLAQRLQKEFLLENRLQELETQLSDLQEKYDRLEEECCELEEIENDTRLHWQQLEMDYELCSAQLRDMTEQRECSRAQAERLMAELARREKSLKSQERSLRNRLSGLEKAVPALIAWNVVQAVGADLTPSKQKRLEDRMGPYSRNPRALLAEAKSNIKKSQDVKLVEDGEFHLDSYGSVRNLEEEIKMLLAERRKTEEKTKTLTKNLERKIKCLEEELEMARRQITVTLNSAEVEKKKIDAKVTKIEEDIIKEHENSKQPVDPATEKKLHNLILSEQALRNRVAELEKRETAYLEMLTQADDMWAEMEDGYKKKIKESQATESHLKNKITNLETERDQWKSHVEPLKRKVKIVEESESTMRVALEKAERDAKALKSNNSSLVVLLEKADSESKKSEAYCRAMESKFKRELEQLRKINKQLDDELKGQKEVTKNIETDFAGDLEAIRKELSRSCKSNQELEVTNSELKEEVESLEKQLTLTQKALNQCKRKCEERIKKLSHELSTKTEELEELRSETVHNSFRISRLDVKPDKTEYIDEGLYTAVQRKTDFGRMHHSLSYITSETRCSCPSLRSQLVGQLIEDLFERMHNMRDEDSKRLSVEMATANAKSLTAESKLKIINYLLMAISKELVRSIGDADAKTDTEEWRRSSSPAPYTVAGVGQFAPLRLEGNAGVVRGAARLASVACACAAARLCALAPALADCIKACQEEVLNHSDVKVMEEQLANAIESIVNCPSCALGTNSVIWSTDV